MALAKREKILAWGVGGVAALLFLDAYVLTPYLNQRKALLELREKTVADEEAAFQVHRQESALKAKWSQRRNQGLASGAAEAEKQLLGAIKNWENETGFRFASMKPDRIDSKKELREIQIQASGSGSNDAVMKFIFKLLTAKFPVRVTDFKLGTTLNNADLALQMRISTLYLIEDKKDNAAPKKDEAKKVAAKRKEGSSRED